MEVMWYPDLFIKRKSVNDPDLQTRAKDLAQKIPSSSDAGL